MGVERVAGSCVASEGVNEVPERNLMPRRAGSPATHRSGLLRRCLPASGRLHSRSAVPSPLTALHCRGVDQTALSRAL